MFFVFLFFPKKDSLQKGGSFKIPSLVSFIGESVKAGSSSLCEAPEKGEHLWMSQAKGGCFSHFLSKRDRRS